MVSLRFCSLIIGILLTVLKPTSAADAVTAVDCSSDATVCDNKNAICNPNGSTCKCKTGYKEAGNDQSTCEKVLGSVCTTVCSVTNSECQAGHCKCKGGYTETKDVCLKAGGQKCTKNEECSTDKCEGATGEKTCAVEKSGMSVLCASSIVYLSVLVAVLWKLL